MLKAHRHHQQVIVICILLMMLCLLILTVQSVKGASIYSDELPESGVYVCEELGAKLSFTGEEILASYNECVIPVWVDYGDNLYFEDGDINPIATSRWDIENDALILIFRRAPQWGEEDIPYVFSISE